MRHGHKGRRVGAVLVRLPYGRRNEVAALPALADIVTARGWALVAQDVRGKHDSTGVREPFVHEVADAAATLRWIAEQGWTDGRVVAAGDSYFGYTALAAAATGHPSVRGVMARVTSPYIDQWMSPHGVFRLGLFADWAASTWASASEGLDVQWEAPTLTEMVPGPEASRLLVEWATNSTGSGYWRPHALDLPEIARSQIPVVHVGGWWDVFRDAQLATWRELRALAPGTATQALRMSAVDHVLDALPEQFERPVDMFSSRALRAAAAASEALPVIELLDLLDGRTGALAPVRWSAAHMPERASADWPAREVREVVVYPTGGHDAVSTESGGRLSVQPAERDALARWTHDPADLVPSLEQDLWRPLLRPADHAPVHARDDVATFTSPDLHSGLALAGPVRFYAELERWGANPPLVVSLHEVRADGSALQLLVAAVAWPAGRTTAEVNLGSTAHLLRPGSRLRLAVATSSWPQFLPIDQAVDVRRTPLTTAFGKRTPQQLHLGPSTRLVLTVLDKPGGPVSAPAR